MSKEKPSLELYSELEDVINRHIDKEIMLIEVLGVLDLLSRSIFEANTAEEDNEIDEVDDKPWL